MRGHYLVMQQSPQIICFYDLRRSVGSINIRQLLNPILCSPVMRHPDATRQRKAKQTARNLRAARVFKAYVSEVRAHE